jgi:hypothetical protein
MDRIRFSTIVQSTSSSWKKIPVYIAEKQETFYPLIDLKDEKSSPQFSSENNNWLIYSIPAPSNMQGENRLGTFSYLSMRGKLN